MQVASRISSTHAEQDSTRAGLERRGAAENSESARLSRVVERELGWAILNDKCEAARSMLIEAHTTMVDPIARNYANRGVAMPELLRAGNEGLMRAVGLFDPATGRRFSTLATWCIKDAIRTVIFQTTPATDRPVARLNAIDPTVQPTRAFGR
ncbi:MAG: sigma factor [Phycisphaerales bacterium]